MLDPCNHFSFTLRFVPDVVHLFGSVASISSALKCTAPFNCEVPKGRRTSRQQVFPLKWSQYFGQACSVSKVYQV